MPPLSVPGPGFPLGGAKLLVVFGAIVALNANPAFVLILGAPAPS